jgi:integrase
MREVAGPGNTVVKERTERWGRGLRYRARYTGPDGRERSQSFPDGRKREAEAFASAQVTDIRRGSWTDPDDGRVTLREFTEDTWLPSLTSNPTTQVRIASQVRTHILPSLGDRELGKLAKHPSVIQRWVSALPVAPSTAQGILAVLSGILAAALEDGMISRNPCRTVRGPAVPQRRIVPWEADRAAAVREALPERYRAMADCGDGLGLRQSEVFGLDPASIDWLRHVVHVRQQLKCIAGRMVLAPPKGGRERDVPLPESVQLALAAHMEHFPPAEVSLPWVRPDGRLTPARLLFSTPSGTPLRSNGFGRRVWHPALRKAGVPPGRENGFHALRHRFASVLLSDGASPKDVAEYLGHHDPGFTLRTYVHVMPKAGDRMRRIIDDAKAGIPGPAAAPRSSRGGA